MAYTQNTWSTFKSEKLLAEARSAAAQGKTTTSFQLTMDAVDADPTHIESLYLKLSSLAFLGPKAPPGELEATFKQIQSVFPNFRNTPAIYARHLLSQGEDSQASKVLTEYTNLRQLSFSSLVDLAAAHARLNDFESATESIYSFYLRASQLEELRSPKPFRANIDNSKKLIIITGSNGSTSIDTKRFISALPQSAMQNPIHLKQAIYFEATRLFRSVTDPSHIPQFIRHLPHDEKQFMMTRLVRE